MVGAGLAAVGGPSEGTLVFKKGLRSAAVPAFGKRGERASTFRESPRALFGPSGREGFALSGGADTLSRPNRKGRRLR